MCDFNVFSPAAVIRAGTTHGLVSVWDGSRLQDLPGSHTMSTQFWFTETAWPYFEMPALTSACLWRSLAFSAERRSKNRIPSTLSCSSLQIMQQACLCWCTGLLAPYTHQCCWCTGLSHTTCFRDGFSSFYKVSPAEGCKARPGARFWCANFWIIQLTRIKYAFETWALETCFTLWKLSK